MKVNKHRPIFRKGPRFWFLINLKQINLLIWGTRFHSQNVSATHLHRSVSESGWRVLGFATVQEWGSEKKWSDQRFNLHFKCEFFFRFPPRLLPDVANWSSPAWRPSVTVGVVRFFFSLDFGSVYVFLFAFFVIYDNDHNTLRCCFPVVTLPKTICNFLILKSHKVQLHKRPIYSAGRKIWSTFELIYFYIVFELL